MPAPSARVGVTPSLPGRLLGARGGRPGGPRRRGVRRAAATRAATTSTRWPRSPTTSAAPRWATPSPTPSTATSTRAWASRPSGSPSSRSEAVALGATEICAQGAVPASRARRLPGLRPRGQGGRARAAPARVPPGRAPRRRARRPGSRWTHWFSRLRDAGLGSVPGHRRPDPRRPRSGPPSPAVRTSPSTDWIRVVTAAHRAGLRTTATMVYGHVESAYDQVRHLRTLAARPGRDRRLHRAHPDAVGAHRVAGAGRRRPTRTVDERVAGGARGGAADAPRTHRPRAGGVDEARPPRCPAACWPAVSTTSAACCSTGRSTPRPAPSRAGSSPSTTSARLAGGLGRPVRQRTTTYGDVR